MKQRVSESSFRTVFGCLFATLVWGCSASSSNGSNGGTSGAAGGHGGISAAGGMGGAPCTYAGVTAPVGATFVSTDTCNTCMCTLSGVKCTFRACAPDGGFDAPPENCVLTAGYRYGPIGGNGLYQDHATLTPPAAYAYVRMGSQRADAGDVSCMPGLPACGSAAAIDVSDIERDILHTDVQKALQEATPPSYGRDDRPVDGTMFEFLRADGHGFLMGGPCPTSGAPACVPPPEGIAHLVADLRDLDMQQLNDPSCAALQP